MRVLFDHNLPHKLRASLGEHEILTAASMGWSELKNGELLRAAEDAGVEQNLAGRRLAIIALSTNNWPIVKDHVSRILAAIESSVPGSFQEVDCGLFSRKNTND